MNRLVRLKCALAASAALLTQLAAWDALAAPKAIVEGLSDEDLRERIERAIGETDNPPISRFEARRRAREAGEDAIAVLRSEGYYGYLVEADVADQDEDDQTPPQPVVRIDPGQRFVLAEPEVEWVGTAPDDDTQRAGVAAIDLELGEPGRAAQVLSAEGRVVAAIQKRGYADAEAGKRTVVVDHATQTVDPTYRIVAGDLVKLNGVEVTTEGRTNPASVGTSGRSRW